MSVQTILVDLDSLLDTRIATIAQLHPEASRAVLAGGYRSREVDDFETLTEGVVENADYRYAYENRNVETLKGARPTAMLVVLNDIINKLEIQRIDTPFAERVVLEVNVYPYQLSTAEREMLISSVMTYAGLETEVRICSLSPAELTPGRIKDCWSAVVYYDFNEWFRYHNEELNVIKIPTVLFFSPALYLHQVPDPSELEVEGLEGMSPFSLLEISMVERLKLELLEPKYFSLIEL